MPIIGNAKKCSVQEENPNGENPCDHVGTENLVHMQGSSWRWDSNQGPQTQTEVHRGEGRERNH